MAFDPAAATAAYLAELSPAAHLRAIHYTQGGHWLLLWGWLVGIVVCLIILKTRVLTRIEGALERRKPRPWLTAFVLAVVFSLAAWALTLPWSIYADWWREGQYGLTSQPFVGWFTEGLISLAIGMILGGIFYMLLYWLIRRAPRWWPVWAGVLAAVALMFLVVIQPVVIEPLFNTYKPAPPGPVRAMVVAMGKQVGVPTDKIYIYNGSKQSNRYTANVAGLFGTARVALSDTMFAQHADMAEVRGVVGHEMGHYVHKHILIQAPFVGLLVVVGGLLAKALFPLVQRWTGASEVAGIADPAGLPILTIVASTLSLLGTPVQNSFVRWAEADADRFSVVNFHEPDGLAKALVKTIEYRADSPGGIEEIIFYDHPSVRSRIMTAMEWKAAHLDEAGKETPASTPAPAPPASSNRPAASAG